MSVLYYGFTDLTDLCVEIISLEMAKIFISYFKVDKDIVSFQKSIEESVNGLSDQETSVRISPSRLEQPQQYLILL